MPVMTRGKMTVLAGKWPTKSHTKLGRLQNITKWEYVTFWSEKSAKTQQQQIFQKFTD